MAIVQYNLLQNKRVALVVRRGGIAAVELPELGEQLTQALDRLASRVGLSHTFNRTVVLQ